jgi:hypothetical protein
MLRFAPPRRLVSVTTALAMAMAFSSAPALAATDGSPAKSNSAKIATASAELLTQDQALNQARSIGRTVPITGDETATSSLAANPNGTLTLSTYAQPVRKEVNGSWHTLDATLEKNSNGTVSPTLSNSPLTLSGGGTAPLVTMRSGIYGMALSVPVSLPAPSLAGDTATYKNVISGVDLVVTVNDQGGFSDVYVVHDAAAAADPKLSSLLTTTTHAPGLLMSVDASGTIHAANSRGRDVFTAPAPAMWDSATSATVANASKAQSTVADKITATASSIAAPGSRSHRARLGEHLSGSTLSLSADPALTSSSSLSFPLYMDPAWSAYSNGQWATVSENFPTQSYWDTSAESGNLMQVGVSPEGFWADSLINFNIPTGELYTGGLTPKFESAYFYATNYATDNPNTSTTDLYAPSATLSSSNATWNNWFTSGRNLGSPIGSANFAQNASSSEGFSISTGWISSSTSVQTFALAGDSYSDESSNAALYKVFDNPTTGSGTAAPSLALTFSHAPTVFDLSTSPNGSTIGDGSVALKADVSDVDGGTLSVAFDAYITNHSGEVIKSATLPAGSGTGSTMWIYQPTLDADIVSSAFGNTATTTSMSISWSVTVTNANGQNATSAVQSFTYSTAVPGAPNIWVDSGHTTGCPNTPTNSYTVGTAATFYLTPEVKDATKPTTYTYQLNGGQPINVSADSNGAATISVTPTSQLNVLTVDAIASSGNIGQPQLCDIPAGGAPNASPGDLSGGPDPDLLVTGTSTSSLPSGLWLASGSSNGQIDGNAVNIGVNGDGQSKTNFSATTYNGTQTISGLFQGSGFNDVLVYNPTIQTANEECSGTMITTLGNGLALNPDWNIPAIGTDFTLNDGSPTAECATSIANGGNLDLAEDDSPDAPATSVNPAADGDAAFPDLLEVVGGSLYLNPTTHATGTYTVLSSAVDLTDASPTGGSWAGWTITTLNTSGDIPYMFAVNQSTGAVFYYSTATLAALAWDAIQGGSASTTPVSLASSGYGASKYTQVSATAVNGTPALWGVTPSGGVSTFELNTAGTGLTQSGSTTPINVTSHEWAMNDGGTGTVTAADAGASPLTLTGSGSVTYNTGDIFSPDLNFAPGVNGTLNGTVATTEPGLDLTSSFTLSIWADPEIYGTMVLSQNGTLGTLYPGLMLYPTPSGWELYLAKDNGAGTWDGDSIVGGSVQLGAWAHRACTWTTLSSPPAHTPRRPPEPPVTCAWAPTSTTAPSSTTSPGNSRSSRPGPARRSHPPSPTPPPPTTRPSPPNASSTPERMRPTPTATSSRRTPPLRATAPRASRSSATPSPPWSPAPPPPSPQPPPPWPWTSR